MWSVKYFGKGGVGRQGDIDIADTVSISPDPSRGNSAARISPKEFISPKAKMTRLFTALAVVCTATAQTLAGIDVSSYQGGVDWKSVAASGQQFAFTKATEGVTYTDDQLAANWAGINAAGMTRGAYHFGHPSIDAVAQANYFVNAVNAGELAYYCTTHHIYMQCAKEG